MHIISIKMLRAFWQKHPAAESVLREWHAVVEHVDFSDFNHVREFFNSADYVPPYTVFNVGGNNYRLVVIVRYRFNKVFVQKVMRKRGQDRISREAEASACGGLNNYNVETSTYINNHHDESTNCQMG